MGEGGRLFFFTASFKFCTIVSLCNCKMMTTEERKLIAAARIVLGSVRTAAVLGTYRDALPEALMGTASDRVIENIERGIPTLRATLDARARDAGAKNFRQWIEGWFLTMEKT